MLGIDGVIISSSTKLNKVVDIGSTWRRPLFDLKVFLTFSLNFTAVLVCCSIIFISFIFQGLDGLGCSLC